MAIYFDALTSSQWLRNSYDYQTVTSFIQSGCVLRTCGKNRVIHWCLFSFPQWFQSWGCCRALKLSQVKILFTKRILVFLRYMETVRLIESGHIKTLLFCLPQNATQFCSKLTISQFLIYSIDKRLSVYTDIYISSIISL